jgi:hypothetical protein
MLGREERRRCGAGTSLFLEGEQLIGAAGGSSELRFPVGVDGALIVSIIIFLLSEQECRENSILIMKLYQQK